MTVRVGPAGLARVLCAQGREGLVAESPALEAALEELLAAARRAWPGVQSEPAAFVRYLAERLPARVDVIAELKSLHATDLYLACGCAQGDAAAMAAFERHILPAVSPTLARLRLPAALADEVMQALRVRFFTTGEGPARIGAYSGHGSLAGWVKIAAVREATRLRRRRKTHGEPRINAELERQAVGPDPAIAYLKRRCAAEFSAAFAAAFAALPSRARNVLRLHFGQGLNIDQIGALYHVHRATVARWIGHARAALLDETRRALAERLQLQPQELESLMDLVRSQVQLSLSTNLSPDGER